MQTFATRAQRAINRHIDAQVGLRAIVRDHAAWRRFALVTDVGWVVRATRVFAWAVPGDLLVTEPDRLEEAKRWVAG